MGIKFNNVIVFDIDGLLCWQRGAEFLDANVLRKVHPECNIVLFPVVEGEYVHCFIPYLDVLFDCLINSNNRIAFFSAGPELRNVIVIKKLLINLFGIDKYENLKNQGQFEVFSSHHLRDAIPEKGEIYTSFIKDLNIVLKENESMDNSILIEDIPYYAAYDQMPCIVGIKLEDLTDYPKEDHFSKNATYYLLGLFKEYLDVNKNPENKPIRIWFKEFLLKSLASYYNYDHDYANLSEIGMYYLPNGTEPWVNNLIISGFNEVQKKHPKAILYDMEQSESNQNTIHQENVEQINFDFGANNVEFDKSAINLDRFNFDNFNENNNTINLEPTMLDPSMSQSNISLNTFNSFFHVTNENNKSHENDLLLANEEPNDYQEVAAKKLKLGCRPS